MATTSELIEHLTEVLKQGIEEKDYKFIREVRRELTLLEILYNKET